MDLSKKFDTGPLSYRQESVSIIFFQLIVPGKWSNSFESHFSCKRISGKYSVFQACIVCDIKV